MGSESDPQKIAVKTACELLENENPASADDKWSVKALAKQVGLTESHFCRVFKKVRGMTIGEYRMQVQKSNSAGTALESRNDLNDLLPELELAPHIIEDCSPSLGLDTVLDFAGGWHEFDAAAYWETSFQEFGGMNLVDIDLSITPYEHVSEHSTPDTLDDGIEFLNF
jgi:AraC-like DNA-binding protein